MLRHFLDLFDISSSEALALLDEADALKREDRPGNRPPLLSGRTLGLVFEKPSMRTRVSFEAAMNRLGGGSIFLPGNDVGLGVRESIRDFARVISQYVDVLATRTFGHDVVEQLARHSSVPVINALSDFAHPCQAMGDVMTIREVLGKLSGVSVVFVGDGNNVAMSLAVACKHVGAEFTLVCPPGFEFPERFRAKYAEAFPGGRLRIEHDPADALRGADVIYTDVWASMGQEGELERRKSVFRPYQVNSALFAAADPDAIFMHCLPAHRGEEVTDEVIDCPRSRVVEQAANRLHIQKALLLKLLLNPCKASLNAQT